jgi:hypothetical protein
MQRDELANGTEPRISKQQIKLQPAIPSANSALGRLPGAKDQEMKRKSATSTARATAATAGRVLACSETDDGDGSGDTHGSRPTAGCPDFSIGRAAADGPLAEATAGGSRVGMSL